MAVVLPRESLTKNLWNVARYSDDFLFIITPKLNITGRFKRIIETASLGGTNVFIVFSEDDNSTDTYRWVKKLENVDLRIKEGLTKSVFANSEIVIECEYGLDEIPTRADKAEIVSEYESDREPRQYKKLLKNTVSLIEDSLLLYSTVTLDFHPGHILLPDPPKMFTIGKRDDVIDNLPHLPAPYDGSDPVPVQALIDFDRHLNGDIPDFWNRIWTEKDSLRHTRPDPTRECDYLNDSLRRLFSRKLPDGQVMELRGSDGSFEWNGFRFGVDAIVPAFFRSRGNDVSRSYSSQEEDFKSTVTDYIQKTDLLGAFTIYPIHTNSLIQAMYANKQIRGRWDLTIECIRRHYAGEDSPLSDCMKRDRLFYELFADFDGFVTFFHLEDFVNADGSVRLLRQTELFEPEPVPRTWAEYKEWYQANAELVEKRNQRMKEHYLNGL